MNLVVPLLVLWAAFAPQKRSSADGMLKTMVDAFAMVKDYTVTLEADIDMEQLKIPRRSATMYFKAPDKVHFDAPGFALLPREGLLLNPIVLRDRYDGTVMGDDTVDGRKAIKLQLAAKEESTRLRQLYIWVDPSNWTVVKAETIPYEGRTLTFLFRYSLQDGKYWMPSVMSASLGLGAKMAQQSQPSPSPKPMLDEFQRGPRSGTVTIRYSDWKVNTGLPDRLFEEPEK